MELAVLLPVLLAVVPLAGIPGAGGSTAGARGSTSNLELEVVPLGPEVVPPAGTWQLFLHLLASSSWSFLASS